MRDKFSSIFIFIGFTSCVFGQFLMEEEKNIYNNNHKNNTENVSDFLNNHTHYTDNYTEKKSYLSEGLELSNTSSSNNEFSFFNQNSVSSSQEFLGPGTGDIMEDDYASIDMYHYLMLLLFIVFLFRYRKKILLN